MREGKSRKIILKLTPEESEAVCGGEVEIFIEVFLPAHRLLILGGGHIGKKLGEICELIGFPYLVVDDRPEFANRERFPGAIDIFAGDYSQFFDKAFIDEKTFIIIVTRGHSFDRLCLQRSLLTPACYIGMLGSKSKVKAVFTSLAKEGIEAEKDPRVYSPVGLKLGNKTPGEIALSIMAEILLLKSGGELKHMKDSL